MNWRAGFDRRADVHDLRVEDSPLGGMMTPTRRPGSLLVSWREILREVTQRAPYQYLPPDPHAARASAAATTPKTGAVLRDQGFPTSHFK
jgi:hypothetical protein